MTTNILFDLPDELFQLCTRPRQISQSTHSRQIPPSAHPPRILPSPPLPPNPTPHQSRMITDLPQLRQPLQDIDRTLSHPFLPNPVQQRRPVRIPEPVINSPLLLPHLTPQDHLRPVREIPRYLLLRPPQHERVDQLPQPRRGLLIPIPVHRRRKLRPEKIGGPKHSRIQEIHLRIQIKRTVLHRRPAQCHPIPRLQPLYSLPRLGGYILDRLALIQDHISPLHRRQFFHIAPQYPIARQHNPTSPNRVQSQNPRRTVINTILQVRYEFFHLGFPIVQNGSRTDHQVRLTRIPLCHMPQETQRLQRLPQTHI